MRIRHELTLINLTGKDDTVKEATERFEAYDDSCWGWEQFIKIKELSDMGYGNNDRILVRAYVSILEE